MSARRAPRTASAAVIASFSIVHQLVSGNVGALLAAGPPAWVWATLLMAGFAALTVFTMLLTRIPTLRRPPDDHAPAIIPLGRRGR